MINAERLNALKGTKSVRLFDIEEDADTTTREVTISFSSETDEVETRMGIEILGHQPGEVDMTRINTGAPLLWMHNWDDQRGVVVRAWIDSKAGRGYAVVRLSKSPLGEQLLQDINDGIVTKVSVGYEVRAVRAIDDDAYRVTSWAPYEISFVSVPADNSVGVGRSYSPQEQTYIAEIQAAGPSHRLAALVQHLPDFTRTITQESHSSMTVPNILATIITEAENTPPFDIRFDEAGKVIRSIPLSQAAGRDLDIRTLAFPAIKGGTDHLTYVPRGTEAGKVTKLSDEIARRSIVSQAGANILVIPTAPEPQAGQVMTRTTSGLIIVEPASVVQMPDGEEVPVSSLPFLRSDVNRSTIPNLAVRFSIPRSLQRQYFAGQIPDIALSAIGLSIANAVDKLLLDAVAASTPAAFSLGAAAAKSLTFGELRGIVGTSATGATVNENRELTVSGVLAELSSQTAETYVGAWDRLGVAIMSDIRLVARKSSAVTGELEITCWLTAAPLVPSSEYVWKVA